MNLLGNTEDFVDKHAVDSIKTRLSDMIVTGTDHVGIDGPKINFKSQVRRLLYSSRLPSLAFDLFTLHMNFSTLLLGLGKKG